ncbi:PLP-binding domain-containing protein [Parafrankia soli]|uniref:Pyridoxal phosphate homeostasis protein n=1 Tax=Parafrankia soli TaxID=2599596 RepID=A0A1S1Q456_9ACTN|nr:YggS family pyridoxal phosphate enzyme [Parafrankia soli]OHV28349.1 PLP-binding domain-containing protein [Parafrankia soli]CAI7979478.1 Pyridoxal phosphate homeostasis protein [Frankia sp. Hr75.2]
MSGLEREVDPRRLAELRERLTVVRDRITVAARDAGRDPAELTLIAVSKTRPAEDVLALVALGVRHFAENREQEAGPKTEAVRLALAAAAAGGSDEHTMWSDDDRFRESSPLADTSGAWRPSRVDQGPTLGPAAGPDVPVWHFVGQLQRNKARAVAGWVHCVQSVDRARLVEALSRAATARGRQISVCIQVNLDITEPVGAPGAPAARNALSTRESEPTAGAVDGARGGALPADVPALAELVAGSEGLVLTGVMAVAPRGAPARPAFARLREVADRLRSEHPAATLVSAGMSGDLEDAVAEGATHLRIGTALFGERHGVP